MRHSKGALAPQWDLSPVSFTAGRDQLIPQYRVVCGIDLIEQTLPRALVYNARVLADPQTDRHRYAVELQAVVVSGL